MTLPSLKSRKPLRKSQIKRKKYLKKKSRSAAERRRIYGPKGYVEWLHQQWCVACGYSPSECAHIKTGGMGRKDDWTRTVPLCGPRYSPVVGENIGGCHRLLHCVGREAFQRIQAVDLEKKVAKTHAAWLSYLSNGAE